jgi:uncharacterized membrane protein YtjA (UPF0391 family)
MRAACRRDLPPGARSFTRRLAGFGTKPGGRALPSPDQDQADLRRGPDMFKFAVMFLVISLVAGALGLTNISVVAKRIAMVLFALFFLMAALLFGVAWMIGEAIVRSSVLLGPVLTIALT